MTATVSERVSSFFTLVIPGVTNPNSTSLTSSFQLFTLDANQAVLDQQTNSIFLQATAGSLLQASLASTSQYVGDTSNNITVTFTTSNPVDANGTIKLAFPYWNPQAAGTIYSLYSYMVNTSQVVCTVTGGAPFLVQGRVPCTFKAGSTQTLTISQGVFTDLVPAGTKIIFQVARVKNPISQTPVTNIKVSTTDALGGIVDSAALRMHATMPGNITVSSVNLTTTLVQQLTQYRL